MSEKPEALRLAENLENPWWGMTASPSGLPEVSLIAVGALRVDAARMIRDQRDKIERLTADNERLNAVAFQAQNAAIDLAQRYKRLKGLLLDIRNDAQASHWHRDINEALQEPPR